MPQKGGGKKETRKKEEESDRMVVEIDPNAKRLPQTDRKREWVTYPICFPLRHAEETILSGVQSLLSGVDFSLRMDNAASDYEGVVVGLHRLRWNFVVVVLVYLDQVVNEVGLDVVPVHQVVWFWCT